MKKYFIETYFENETNEELELNFNYYEIIMDEVINKVKQ